MRSPSSNANITSQHEFEKMLPPPAFVNSIPPARVTLTAEVRQPALSLPPSPPPPLQCLFYLNFENISVQLMSR